MTTTSNNRSGNWVRALFGNPEIYIELPKDYALQNEISHQVDTCACLCGDTLLVVVPLPVSYKNRVLRRLWRYKFEVEQKTTDDGRKNILLRFIRRRKFLFF